MTESQISSLYTTDEYITKNPDLHESDSPWKISKLIPLVDKFASEHHQEKLNILDVGGGAGVILQEIGKHVQESFGKEINKYCLDLSPGMLKVQQENNPDAQIIESDIAKSGLKNKEIDLLLFVDVLEHVENPTAVLQEISRISKFAILKVPLENTLYFNLMNFLTRGNFRKRIIESIGHINVYSAKSLEAQVEKYCGEVIKKDFTNVYKYLWKNPDESFVSRVFNFFGFFTYLVSPKLSARVFNDYIILLIKCK